jgi:hypothetical protein
MCGVVVGLRLVHALKQLGQVKVGGRLVWWGREKQHRGLSVLWCML